jgi:hypothetical protein
MLDIRFKKTRAVSLAPERDALEKAQTNTPPTNK